MSRKPLSVQAQQDRLRRKRREAGEVLTIFRKPLKESLTSVLPITAIVLVLCFTITPISNNAMMAFLLGSLLLIVGMGLFTLGSEMSMIPLGEAVGKEITRSKKVWVIVAISFLIGVIITVAEPDLQVLAGQVPSIPDRVIIWSVALGVGVFLVIALLRILFAIQLSYLLIGFYAIVFVLAGFVSPDFWAVAFDSGGVTTGPMTVPFIMALGVGVSAVRNDREAGGDSFGLVALCSIGPIITVLLLGLLLAALSIAFCEVIHAAPKLYKKLFPNAYLRVVVGGALIIALTTLLGTTDYNGAGANVIAAAIAGQAVPYAFLLKMLFTSITLGAGFKGGEIVPIFFTGATFGCAVAPLLGLAPGLGAALGMVALFCGCTNSPLASICLAIEVFGGQNIELFALACAVSYMMSSYFSLYREQHFLHSKLRVVGVQRVHGKWSETDSDAEN